MANLVYSAIASLDGYIADADGGFAWAAPDDEVHRFVNDLERPVGTYLYGRRLYETMAVWETIDTGPAQTPEMRDYARIWRAAEKVVFSRSLTAVGSARTRVEHDFDPALVARIKAESDQDVSVGGATLASTAFRAGLVDVCHLFLHPVAVGGGTPALPPDQRVNLALLGTHAFGSGVVHLHYAVRP